MRYSLIPLPEAVELPLEDGWIQWDLAVQLRDGAAPIAVPVRETELELEELK